MHKGDLERGMLKQWPTLDITHSNRYQVRAQVDKVQYHIIQSARDNIAELYDLHRFESAAERLEFIDSLLAKISIFFLQQSVWKVVYMVQILRSKSRKLMTNG